ncbi:hypothetical protein [Rummeliibacillus suwonensis]|uniref:hypothetical protein n=1 Tax=Rummeliibacillus suwonensis TaxID=1306154 RepID=UPI0016489B45|nr:hypothetical protein [Rummeliibacillus suwonensis]
METIESIFQASRNNYGTRKNKVKLHQRGIFFIPTEIEELRLRTPHPPTIPE